MSNKYRRLQKKTFDSNPVFIRKKKFFFLEFCSNKTKSMSKEYDFFQFDSGTDTITNELPAKKQTYQNLAQYPKVEHFDGLCVKFKGLGGIRLARFDPRIEGLPEIVKKPDSVVYVVLKDVFGIAQLPTYAIDISRALGKEGKVWKRVFKFDGQRPFLGLPLGFVVDYIQNNSNVSKLNSDLICEALEGGEFSTLSDSDDEEIQTMGTNLERCRRLERKEEKPSKSNKRKKQTNAEKSEKKTKYTEEENEKIPIQPLLDLIPRMWPHCSEREQKKLSSLLANITHKYMAKVF